MVEIPKPWFPSLFTWEPVFNSKGEQKLGLRHRRGDDPREIYGTIDCPKQKQEPITSLRFKFLAAFFLQIPLGLLRIPFRVIHLLAGDFVQPAANKARNEWLVRVQTANLRADPNQQALSQTERRAILARYLVQEVAENVGKVVLCVLAIIPLWMIAFSGIVFNPYDAAFFFSKIEKLCAREYIPIYGNGGIRKDQLHLGDFLMPCLQTELVLMKRNLYRMFRDYNPETLRSLMCDLHNQFVEKETFLTKERMDIPRLCASIHLWREALSLKLISRTDGGETDAKGNLYCRTEPQKEVADQLVKMREQIKCMETATETNDSDSLQKANSSFNESVQKLNKIFA